MTYDLDQELAPGCYGVPLMHKPDTTECRTCPFSEACGPRSREALETVRARLGITVEAPRKAPPARPKVEVKNGDALVTVSAKAHELMERFDRAGIKIIDNLRAGINPFIREDGKPRPKFMAIICQILMRDDIALTRQLLMTTYMRKLNWSKDTAASHATLAFQVLVGVGAAQNIDGKLMRKI